MRRAENEEPGLLLVGLLVLVIFYTVATVVVLVTR